MCCCMRYGFRGTGGVELRAASFGIEKERIDKRRSRRRSFLSREKLAFQVDGWTLALSEVDGPSDKRRRMSVVVSERDG